MGATIRAQHRGGRHLPWTWTRPREQTRLETSGNRLAGRVVSRPTQPVRTKSTTVQATESKREVRAFSSPDPPIRGAFLGARTQVGRSMNFAKQATPLPFV